jgi:hypothetical protein
MLAPPQLSNTSTASEESAEEFPLQGSYETGSAILTKAEFTPQPSIKSVRPKRFSLRAIARPFIKSSKGNVKSSTKGDEPLRSAQKSSDDTKKAQRRFRVSFSPSTEDEHVEYAAKAKARRASFDDSIGKSKKHPIRKRALSISWDQKKVHTSNLVHSRQPSLLSTAKGKPARPRTSKEEAVAAKKAVKHAQALEQIINAGASLNIDSVDHLKAKREMKIGAQLDKTKVQMVPAVSPRKAKALGTALMDSVAANEIIGELRAMQLSQKDTLPALQEHSQASEELKRLQQRAKEIEKAKQTASQPIRAACLDCREDEIELRQIRPTLKNDEENVAIAVQNTAVSYGVTNLWGWLRSQENGLVALPQEAVNIETALPIASPDTLLSGVSPISFILSPAGPTNAVGDLQSTAFDLVGSLSGAAISAVNGGDEEMQAVHPPLDRMAILVHWWGYELTIPPPSMAYLGRAQNISSSLMGILQTIALSGGVPEILPFVRYFSTFVDMEFGAIKSQDHGHGTVVAATWLMPIALVPRPWDYPTTSNRPPLLSSSTSPLEYPAYHSPSATHLPAFTPLLHALYTL